MSNSAASAHTGNIGTVAVAQGDCAVWSIDTLASGLPLAIGNVYRGTLSCDATGSLNGTTVSRELVMTMATSPDYYDWDYTAVNGVCDGSVVTFTYSLAATVAGNVGSGSSLIQAGGSLSGLGAIDDDSGTLASVATHVGLLAGSNASGTAEDLEVSFGNPSGLALASSLVSDIASVCPRPLRRQPHSRPLRPRHQRQHRLGSTRSQ